MTTEEILTLSNKHWMELDLDSEIENLCATWLKKCMSEKGITQSDRFVFICILSSWITRTTLETITNNTDRIVPA